MSIGVGRERVQGNSDFPDCPNSNDKNILDMRET